IRAFHVTGVQTCALPIYTLDGLGKYYSETIEESDAQPVDVVQTLKDAKVDVLVCYLPVGSEAAAKFYAQSAIDAGVAFVNALPELGRASCRDRLQSAACV